MIQAIPKHVTVDDFIAWYPENSEHRYKLDDRVIILKVQQVFRAEE